jgi:hypothetical protein
MPEDSLNEKHLEKWQAKHIITLCFQPCKKSDVEINHHNHKQQIQKCQNFRHLINMISFHVIFI